ncbi:hypothetical protein F5146DRAFT_1135891 [Armillaria mellea]|nr:hypothetical protein F5146DRAFT_1135891 [Armillaria mellea]
MSCFTCRDCGSINLLFLESRFKVIQSSNNLLLQILRRQQPLLDASHTLLTAEIAELEQQQSVYATHLEEIQLRQCAALKAIESRKSVYAPIHRLPRDILIEIFHSVCDFWWQEKGSHNSLDVSGPLWVLGRVCGVWRGALHSSPASWARKLVVRGPFSKHSLEILQTCLDHTGEHLLNLQLSCRNSADHAILSLLVQSCQRWKILRIDVVKSCMPHFESISFPALEAIQICIHNLRSMANGSDYRLDMCLGALQLRHARLQGHGICQIRLPPGISQYSGFITSPEDLRLLSQLRNLRRCHLWMTRAMATMEVLVVRLAQVTHLYVDGGAILNFLSAPLLDSLTINPITQRPHSFSTQESITRFLQQSRCHLKTLSIGKEVFRLGMSTRMFESEACSTISRLKLELYPGMIDHLILCLFQPSGVEYATILPLCNLRRNGMNADLANDIRAHSGDGDLEMRVEKWDPPGGDVYLSQLP